MLIIRLKPQGRVKRISYRIVVSEKRSKLTGTAIDDLGFYDTTVTPTQMRVDRKKLTLWQQKGARISPRVQKILADSVPSSSNSSI